METSTDNKQDDDASDHIAEMMELILGYQLSQCVHVAAKLGIADLLANGPMSIDELARASQSHPPFLQRLLRVLACKQIFAENSDGSFRLTPKASLLSASSSPIWIYSAAVFWSDPHIWQPFGHLLGSIKTGETAFDKQFGATFFQHLEKAPEFANQFSITLNDVDQHRSLKDLFDFSKINTVVDIGGGYGSLIVEVLKQHSHLHGTVYDLPYVVESARKYIEEQKMEDRANVLGGDMFTSIPAGFDVYILSRVLMDCDDNKAHLVVRNCRQAMKPGGHCLIIDCILDEQNGTIFGRLSDLGMIILTGGKHRSQRQLHELLEAGNFKIQKISEKKFVHCIAV